MKTLRTIAVTLGLLWLTHAIAFFCHEYAHSFTAWLMHGKTNPLALNYGSLSVSNLLLQGDIDENVDYAPIFSAGRDAVAALIAVAGVLIGNGLSYLVSRLLYAQAKQRGERTLGLFAFLLCLMSVGNFLSYVPLRTFTNHADMHTVEMGLHCSPWVVALGLGALFLIAQVHFFWRVLPDAVAFLFPQSVAARRALVVLAAFVMFCFFGSAGLSGSGAASHSMSMVCLCVLFPLMTVLCWPRRVALAS